MLALSIGANLALAAALIAAWIGWLPLQEADSEAAREALLDDPDVMAEVVRQLADEAYGIHDSHIDAEVGRILFAGVDRTSTRGEDVRANLFGMREKAYAMPKPAGLVRVVLLGDSLVYGLNVQQDQRLGSHLERRLREAFGEEAAVDVEVLSLGIASWNIWNECAFLRRQVGLLRPDLVVHVLTDNDLDDALGVRGFGAMATFSPSRRARGDSRVSRSRLVPGAGKAFTTPLLSGLDHESRTRRAEAAQAVADLAAGLAAIDAEYIPLLYAQEDAALLRDALLPPEQRARALAITAEFAADTENWVDAGDRHWGPTGGEDIADALAAWIEHEGVLRDVGLARVAPADLAARIAAALTTGRALSDPDPMRGFEGLDSVFVSAEDGKGEAKHVYAGLAQGGILRPWACLVLRAPDTWSGAAGPRRLVVRGQALDRPELDGVRIELRVEGRSVGRMALRRGEPFEQRFALPADLPASPFLAIELSAEDHVLLGAFLQGLATAQLTELRLE